MKRWCRRGFWVLLLLALLTAPTLAADSGWMRLEPPIALQAAEEDGFVTAWTADCTTYGDVLTGWAKEAYDSLTEAYAAGEARLSAGEDGTIYWVVGDVLRIGHMSDANAWMTANQDKLWAALNCAGEAFTLDHPEYFWIRRDFQMWVQWDDWTLCCRIDFHAQPESDTMEERAALEAEVQKALHGLLQDTAELSAVERLAYFDNWLCENNSYLHEAAKLNERFGNSLPWNIVGGLTGISDPVCEGYAKSFQVLCDAIGVPCVCLANESHMWNAVRLEDVWYTVDSTWNEISYPNTEAVDDICSSRNYFLTAAPEDWDHVPLPILTTPPVSSVSWVQDWKKMETTIRGCEQADSPCWIALYAASGRMLDCKPCRDIPWGPGTTLYLAPEFSARDLRQAVRTVRFCLEQENWNPALAARELP